MAGEKFQIVLTFPNKLYQETYLELQDISKENLLIVLADLSSSVRGSFSVLNYLHSLSQLQITKPTDELPN